MNPVDIDLQSAKNSTLLSSVWDDTFDVIDDLVTIQDRSLTILRANRATRSFFNASEKDLIGRYCYEVFLQGSEPCPHCPLLDTVPKEKNHQVHVTLEINNKIIEVSSSLISAADNRDYLVHIGRNITEKVALEARLQESENRFALTFHSTPDAVNINRLQDGLFLEINQGFTELTGFTEDDVLNKTSTEIAIWNNPNDRKKLADELEKNGFCKNLETIFRRKDGSLTTALMSASVILLKGVPHIISITRDITKIKLVEKEVAEQKLLFESMFNAIHDGVVITDTNRNILLANKGMTTTFGYTPEELIGKSTSVLYADEANFQQSGQKVYNIDAKSTNQFYLTEYSKKSGRVFPGETFGVKLYDQSQKWIGNLSIIRNVSKQHEITTEHNRLVAAIEHTSDAIVITDQLGNIQYVNPAFENISGYTSEEVIGQNPRLLKSYEQNNIFYKDLWDTISNGHNFTGRMVNKRKDGTLFTEEATISPIKDHNGQIRNYVAVKRDITGQILLEAQLQQAQKMEAVGQLTGGVAHDFNNILSVIIGYTEMAIARAGTGHFLHGDLKHILDAAQRSASIVRQLLAFSRQQTISPKVIELNKAVEEILKMLKQLIGEKIILSWIPGSDLLNIKFDPTQIDQILANLCVNAKDAINGNGTITIETTMVFVSDDQCDNKLGFQAGEYVQLSISDDGCGIDKETQEKIFEPFFTTKTLGHGTGLGLSTVYGIVKQNKGYIYIYSEPGLGTTAKIYFPVCEDIPEIIKNTNKLNIKGNKETILLVEDELSLLTMATRMLETQGYTVLSAATPAEAVQISENFLGEINLLLTDVVLPGMNGNELATLLRLRYENLKVLFMSGYTANVIANNGILNQEINFLQKPYTSNILSSKVREVLDFG